MDGVPHLVAVEYAIFSGFMAIELDGVRVARAWREWQTVVGGANLGTRIGAHELDARVTQTYGSQTYLFAVTLDGETVPGSDVQPTPRQVGQSTAASLVVLGTTVAVITLIGRSPLDAAITIGFGLLCIRAVYLGGRSARRRAGIIAILLVLWVVALMAVTWVAGRV